MILQSAALMLQKVLEQPRIVQVLARHYHSSCYMLCDTRIPLCTCLVGRVTMINIKGDIEGIERSPARTEVLVNEGLTTTSYALDEALIDFASALDDSVSDRLMVQRHVCRLNAVYCTGVHNHSRAQPAAFDSGPTHCSKQDPTGKMPCLTCRICQGLWLL